MDAHSSNGTATKPTANVAAWRSEPDPDCDLEVFWRIVEDHPGGFVRVIAGNLCESEAEMILSAAQRQAALLTIVREVAEVDWCSCDATGRLLGACLTCRARAAVKQATGKDTL